MGRKDCFTPAARRLEWFPDCKGTGGRKFSFGPFHTMFFVTSSHSVRSTKKRETGWLSGFPVTEFWTPMN